MLNKRQKQDGPPYDGMDVTGWPIATIIRGNVVMKDDEMLKPIGEPVLFQETVL